MMDNALKALKSRDREMVLLEHIIAVLHWDQETGMPEAAVNERADQLSMLNGLLHEKVTDSDLGSILNDLGASDAHPLGDSSLSEEDRGLVRTYYREYSREKKIPASWVKEFTEVTAKGQAVWAKARKTSDFPLFKPYLEQVVKLNRERSSLLGYTDHPYDPLLDEYEPGMKTAEVAQVFAAMKLDLVTLLERIQIAGEVDDTFLYREYPKAGQDAFGRMVLKDMGYDFSRGRLDESTHPFTPSLGADDVRITTRYTEPSVSSSLFSTIHEGGHALYEMGASTGSLAGTGIGTGASLAMHESQSRLWENVVGRSKAFWTHYYSRFTKHFAQQTKGITMDAFLRGINKVQPSFIRVDADEVSYGLHVILRFELEQALITGDLSVEDVPHAWNSKMKELLGIVPQTDADGVLQDVHWAFGMIGYFPTYALGNLYGAQLFASLEREVPDIHDQISRGELGEVLTWMRDRIHQYGAIYSAPELLERATGSPLDPAHFTAYLEKKYSDLMGI